MGHKVKCVAPNRHPIYDLHQGNQELGNLAMNQWKQMTDGSWVRHYRLLSGNVRRTVCGNQWSASIGSDIGFRGAGIHNTLKQAMAQVDGMAEAKGLL